MANSTFQLRLKKPNKLKYKIRGKIFISKSNQLIIWGHKVFHKSKINKVIMTLLIWVTYRKLVKKAMHKILEIRFSYNGHHKKEKWKVRGWRTAHFKDKIKTCKNSNLTILQSSISKKLEVLIQIQVSQLHIFKL